MNRRRSTLRFVVGAQSTVIVLLPELAARDHVTIGY